MRASGSAWMEITFLATSSSQVLSEQSEVEPQVDVTFDIDANGILNVTACDQITGAEANVTISSERGRLSDDEIARMVEDAKKYAAEDAAQIERVEAKNKLENMVYELLEVSVLNIVMFAWKRLGLFTLSCRQLTLIPSELDHLQQQNSKRHGNTVAVEKCEEIRAWLDATPQPSAGECESAHYETRDRVLQLKDIKERINYTSTFFSCSSFVTVRPHVDYVFSLSTQNAKDAEDTSSLGLTATVML